jgi:predicted nucleotidyltransferase
MSASLPEITSRQNDLERLCQQYRVRSLAIFGSALTDTFDPRRSDFDFLVKFEDMAPSAYADAYFGLLEGLEALFNRPIDLVTESSLRNPRLRHAIEQNHSLLYAA